MDTLGKHILRIRSKMCADVLIERSREILEGIGFAQILLFFEKSVDVWIRCSMFESFDKEGKKFIVEEIVS